MGTGVGKAPTSVGKQLSVSSSSSGKYRHWGAPLGVIELQWQIEMLRKLLGVWYSYSNAHRSWGSCSGCGSALVVDTDAREAPAGSIELQW
jgi:hypothetical protein